MAFTSNNKFTAVLLGVVLSGLSPLALAVFESQSFVNSNPVTIKSQLEPVTLVKGKPALFRISLEIDKSFRIFTDEVSVRLANQSRFKIQKHQGQPSHRSFDPISKKDKDFLEGNSEIDIEFTWNGKNEVGEFPLTVQFRYEACTAKVCINPKFIYLSTKVNVIESTETRLPSSVIPSLKLASAAEGIRFQKYSEKIYKKSLAQKKPILIDFFASWCESCSRFKNEVFSTPEAGTLTKDFVTLSVDLSDPSEENDLLREKFGVRNLPNVVFVNTRGKIHHELTVNEFEEPSNFFNRIRFFLND